MARGSPGATRRVGLFSLFRAPPPPPASSSKPPTCCKPRRYTHGDATHPPSAVFPLEGRAARLTVALVKIGGPVYDDALSRLGDVPGTLLLMLLTDLAAALRLELDSCKGLRVGWEAIADRHLLALLHRGNADECRWGALVPGLAWRFTYMANPRRGHPRPASDDLIAAFHDHGILSDDTRQDVRQKTLGRDYRRRVRASLVELRVPLRQR